MAIKLKTEEGAEFSFDTVAEFMDFKKQIDEEEASKETESTSDEDTSETVEDKSVKIGDKLIALEDHVDFSEGSIYEVLRVDSDGDPRVIDDDGVDYFFNGSMYGERFRHATADEVSRAEVSVGDKVRVVTAEDGTSFPYHHHAIGSVGKVVSKPSRGGIEVDVDGETQYLLPHHYEKVEALGKDANGEDLYEGDFVTGTEGNDYMNTNDKVVMEVLGAGESFLFREANIIVRIVGDYANYRVDSSEFVKLSDNLDEAKAKFKGDVEVDEPEFKVGDMVKVVENSHGHSVDIGEVREIKDVDTEEPKYNLSDLSFGQWAGTADIELVQNSTKFRTGDIVKVTESFADILGDRVTCGAVYNYDENLLSGEPFVGTIFLEDNLDKIELVCRAQDRLDKY